MACCDYAPWSWPQMHCQGWAGPPGTAGGPSGRWRHGPARHPGVDDNVGFDDDGHNDDDYENIWMIIITMMEIYKTND